MGMTAASQHSIRSDSGDNVPPKSSIAGEGFGLALRHGPFVVARTRPGRGHSADRLGEEAVRVGERGERAVGHVLSQDIGDSSVSGQR